MAFQPMPLLSRFLRKQITFVLKNPLRMIKRLRKRQVAPDPPPITMATYTEAVHKFTVAATELMEQARLLIEARNAYQRWQKEMELLRLRKEIAALRLVIPLLVEEMDTCKIEYSSSGKTDGMPCRKAAAAQCADCGASICADCRVECCGDAFCDQCYHYHATHSCLKKPVQSERDPRAREFLAGDTRAS